MMRNENQNSLPDHQGKARGAASGLSDEERPIIFSGPMVKAVLEGRKTQTRRVIKPQPVNPDINSTCEYWNSEGDHAFWWSHDHGPEVQENDPIGEMFRCPHGKPCNLLWVRESFAVDYEVGEGTRGEIPPAVFYRATDSVTNWAEGHTPWKSPIYMPRWASRLTLEITDVRVERLQEITCFDVMTEGSPVPMREHSNPELGIQCVSAKEWFQGGWDSLNAKRGHSWESNPWVWVIAFCRIQATGTASGLSTT